MSTSVRTGILAVAAAATIGGGTAIAFAATATASSGHPAPPVTIVTSSGGPETSTLEPPQPLVVLEALGLAVGTNDQGDLYGQGPAPLVKDASQILHGLGVNEIVGYTGRNESGTGATVITSGTCVDAPPTETTVNSIDNLTGKRVEVRNGTCANPGSVDGGKVARDADVNLPKPADWASLFF
jgi:hypothetical protein